VIALPEEGRGLHVVASVSGGKDSTALILALREAGIAARYVFADTGWEAGSTYDYLDYLRARLEIEIDVVSADLSPEAKAPIGGAAIATNLAAWVAQAWLDVETEEDPGSAPYALGRDRRGEFAIDRGRVIRGSMMDRARYRAGFPGRMQRWCTRELKIEPLRAYHDALIEETGIETISAIGIRADESEARAKMPEWADEPETRGSWGGYVWRPLLRWSIADVLGIHNRHGIKVNLLYHEGHDRVGCYPCIHERKESIAIIARRHPERIDEIRALEAECTAERARRNLETPGRYAHPVATFFQMATERSLPVGIDAVVEWSRTDRGGRQMPLIAPPARGGCMRWGICDLPQNGGDK
jgi:3'-phosphoadenosine 5'-phosphosulfate sulfotransferase (PAPS reductase)/FAD synthetase